MTRLKPVSLVLLVASLVLLFSVVAHRFIWPPSYPTGAEISRELRRMGGLPTYHVPPPKSATVTTRERWQS